MEGKQPQRSIGRESRWTARIALGGVMKRKIPAGSRGLDLPLIVAAVDDFMNPK
jgi:hypothetical protein